MTYEKSCGAVVFTKTGGRIRYLLIANKGGLWGFPKGHTEGTETEAETALREVYEETGIRIRLLDGFRTTDAHPIPWKKDTVKQITYFLGTYENQEIRFQEEEVSDARLVCFEEALTLFRYESSKRILREADDFLNLRAAAAERNHHEK